MGDEKGDEKGDEMGRDGGVMGEREREKEIVERRRRVCRERRVGATGGEAGQRKENRGKRDQEGRKGH